MLSPPQLSAQTAKVLLTEGISAHGDLEFVAAARLLSRALNPELKPPLSGADRDRALMYLGSAHFIQTEREEAATAFRTLVIGNPRYRPDTLIFPPTVTRVFAEVVQTTKAVSVEVPDQQAVGAGGRDLPIKVYASSAHQISAVILGSRSDTVAVVFDGPIDDSLALSWTGLTSDQKAPPSGLYRLEVSSKLSPTAVMRSVIIPLEIQTTAVAALPAPPQLPDSLFLPERRPMGPALAFLVPGIALGGLVMIPSGLGGVRFALGTAIAAGGITGYILKRPGRPIPDNVAANAKVRQDWSRRSEAAREQARQRAPHRMIVRAGTPERVEEGARR